MAKDPAILFYTSDFLTGTLTMSNEEVGKYIRLLCLQHQKGRLTEKDMYFICTTYVDNVFDKFKKDDKNMYYNERLEEETTKRKAYSESRRKNISKRYEPTYVLHMENENEDVNINKDLSKIKSKNLNTGRVDMDSVKTVKQEYFTDMLPIDSTQQFIEAWNEWCDFRREIKKKLTKLSAKKQLTFLFNQPDPIKCINQSIEKGWTGLFEVTDKSKPKPIEHNGRVVTTKEDNDWRKVLAENEKKLKEQGVWDGKVSL